MESNVCDSEKPSESSCERLYIFPNYSIKYQKSSNGCLTLRSKLKIRRFKLRYGRDYIIATSSDKFLELTLFGVCVLVATNSLLHTWHVPDYLLHIDEPEQFDEY